MINIKVLHNFEVNKQIILGEMMVEKSKKNYSIC